MFFDALHIHPDHHIGGHEAGSRPGHGEMRIHHGTWITHHADDARIGVITQQLVQVLGQERPLLAIAALAVLRCLAFQDAQINQRTVGRSQPRRQARQHFLRVHAQPGVTEGMEKVIQAPLETAIEIAQPEVVTNFLANVDVGMRVEHETHQGRTRTAITEDEYRCSADQLFRLSG